MNEHPINDLMTSTMEKIKQMIDVNTIIGNPIVTQDGTTLIPISKVGFGFGSGGTDFQPKNTNQSSPLCFGGGGGAGVTISPVAFVIISNGDARILPVNMPADSTADRLVEMIPDVINKITTHFESKKNNPQDPQQV